MKKVALVNHFFSHYRLPVLKAMANDKDVMFYFIGDIISNDDIKVVNLGNEAGFAERFIPIKNLFLGKVIWQKGLFRILRKQKFDAFIFLGEDRIITTWLAMLFLRLKGVPVYLWSHGLYGREPLLKKKVRVRFNKLASGMLLYNNRAKQLLIASGLEENKLAVVYNSLNYEQTETFRKTYTDETKERLAKQYFSNPTLPIVFCISRLTKGKKIDLIIEAISVLKGQGFLLNCFIIGNGEEKTKLKTLISEHGLEHQVTLVGALYSESEISQYIMSSDACVCPGAIGLTAIHSLSYGVPIVTNDNFAFQGPEFEAIEPNITGYFYQDGDINDLALQIKNCLKLRSANKTKNMNDCLSVVQKFYNPSYQVEAIKTLV